MRWSSFGVAGAGDVGAPVIVRGIFGVSFPDFSGGGVAGAEAATVVVVAGMGSWLRRSALGSKAAGAGDLVAILRLIRIGIAGAAIATSLAVGGVAWSSTFEAAGTAWSDVWVVFWRFVSFGAAPEGSGCGVRGADIASVVAVGGSWSTLT